MHSKHILMDKCTTALRFVVALVMCFANIFFTRAQASDARVKVVFKFNSPVLSAEYMNNAQALVNLDAMIQSAAASGAVLDIVSYSSPEGNYAYNQSLSEKRAAAVKSYIQSKEAGAKVNITVHSASESWDELRNNVVSDSRLSQKSKEDILRIIDTESDPDTREKLLKANSAYKSLYVNYFRSLRYANIALRIEKSPGNTPQHTSVKISENSSTIRETAGVPVVYYYLSEDFIRPAYMGNAQNMREIRRILSDPANRDRQIVIEGAASPEGPLSINTRLGIKRAQNLADWLVGQYPDLEGRIVIRSKGEDWEGLRAQVESCSALNAQEKDEILAIIGSDNTPNKKEALLKAHSAYSTVEKECLPYIRYARFAGFEMASGTASVTEPATDTTATKPLADSTTVLTAVDTTATLPQVDTIGAKPGLDTLVSSKPGIVPVFRPEAKRGRNTIAAVKTNLLYDAVSALNVEVEVPIWDRLSVMVEDVFPWWETGNKYCFQLWEMGVEARYWFKPWNTVGTEKLRGFFAGPYVMSGKYDFQWDKQINYQGEMWSAGVTAGFAMPIGKKQRANLEFSLSMGYMKSPYRHYLPTDDYSKLIHDPLKDATFYNIFMYPTKAKVSLVVPLNIPTRKEVSHD